MNYLSDTANAEKWIRKTLLHVMAALAYAGTAILSIYLAVPPSFASPIFPAAGVALAAVLVWGKSLWMGIFFGSLLMNSFIQIRTFDSINLSFALTSLAISVGAVLQALVGRWLIHKFVGRDLALLERKVIILFLTLAAPVSSVINATVGVGSLFLSGKIPWIEIAHNWFTWWLGDTMGILVVLPLALCVWGEPRVLWNDRRWTVGLPIVAGFIISLCLFVITSEWEAERTSSRFREKALNASNSIEKALSTKIEILYALRDAISVVDDLSFTHFESLTKGLLERDQGVHFVRWLPRVTHQQRANFEAFAKEDDANFWIWTVDPTGKPVVQDARDEYFPIRYVVPMAPFMHLIGLDVSSVPEGFAAIEKTRIERRAIASSPSAIYTSPGDHSIMQQDFAVFLYAPVFEANGNLRGMVSIGLRGDITAASSVWGSAPAQFGRLAIYDETGDQRGSIPIFEHIDESPIADIYKSWRERFNFRYEFIFASRRYAIHVAPKAEFLHASKSLVSWEMSLVGLMLTSLLAISQLVTTGANAKLSAVSLERADALRLMRNAETSLRLSQQAARAGSFEWKAESDSLMCSPEWEAIYGVKQNGFAKTLREWEDMIHPDDRLRFKELNAQTLQSGEPIEAEWRTVWPDGSVHWISSRYQGFNDSSAGSAIRLAGVCIDVTDRKRIQDDLAHSERRFRALVDASAQIFWTTSADGRVNEDSLSWRAFTGQSFEQYKEFGSLEALHPDDRDRAVREWSQSKATNMPYKSEVRIRHVSGEWRWFAVRAVQLRNSDGSLQGWVGMNSDITERKLAEQAVKESETRFRTIFEQAAMGVALVDAMSGSLFRVNNKFCELTGYSSEELVGQKFDSLTHPFDLAGMNDHVRRLQNSECTEFSLEQRRFRKDGSVFWVSVTISRIWKNDESPTQYIAIIKDITEKIQAREFLYKSNELLEQRVETRTAEIKRVADDLARTNTELEQFAYIASHDLQEPLRRITSYVGLFLDKYRPSVDGTGEKYLNYISDGARRMSVLIDDMLAYSLIGKGEDETVDVDLDDVLSEVIRIQRATIEQTNAIVEASSLPNIPISKTQAYQLFSNLISNALKFRQPNGRPHVRINSTFERGTWHFTVTDNGIGIGREYLEDIFVIFKRLHSRTNYSGTGIGLSICKKIVERMGGKIWADSKIGLGTTIHFTVSDQHRDRIEDDECDIVENLVQASDQASADYGGVSSN